MTYIMVVLLMAIVALAVKFRIAIADIAEGVYFDTLANWHIFKREVWPRIRATIKVAGGIFSLLWFMLFVLMMVVGLYAKATISAFVITILLPFWFAAFIMPSSAKKIWLLGPMIKIGRNVLSPVLLLATIFLCFGLWSPSIKEGYENWSASKKEILASFFKKNSISDRAKADMIGIVNQASEMYDGNANMIPGVSIKAGMKVMAVEGKAKKIDGSQALAKVMLGNTMGSFVNGNVVYIPAHRITWSKS